MTIIDWVSTFILSGAIALTMMSRVRESILFQMIVLGVIGGLFYLNAITTFAFIYTMTLSLVLYLSQLPVIHRHIQLLLKWSGVVGVALLMLHQIPGFNFYIFDHLPLITSHSTAEFPLLFEKGIAALIMSAFYCQNQNMYIERGRGYFYALVLSVAGIFIAQYINGNTIDIKISTALPLIMVGNLLFIVLCEALFFSAMIQFDLHKRLGFESIWRIAIPIAVSAVLFTIYHIGIDPYHWQWTLTLLAGTIYGCVYYRFGLLAAIATQWTALTLGYVVFSTPLH